MRRFQLQHIFLGFALGVAVTITVGTASLAIARYRASAGVERGVAEERQDTETGVKQLKLRRQNAWRIHLNRDLI